MIESNVPMIDPETARDLNIMMASPQDTAMRGAWRKALLLAWRRGFILGHKAGQSAEYKAAVPIASSPSPNFVPAPEETGGA